MIAGSERPREMGFATPRTLPAVDGDDGGEVAASVPLPSLPPWARELRRGHLPDRRVGERAGAAACTSSTPTSSRGPERTAPRRPPCGGPSPASPPPRLLSPASSRSAGS